MIITPEGRAYQKEAIRLARRSGIIPLKGEIRVRFDVYRPWRRGDLSNFVKVVEDCLKGLAWEDDEQTVYIEMHRHEDKHNPRVHVTIEGDRI